uniref:Uncharacterized protein n=1 Tax=Arundo donax TaxID=35708 RepID=A0A0A9AA31_ARUDO
MWGYITLFCGQTQNIEN